MPAQVAKKVLAELLLMLAVARLTLVEVPGGYWVDAALIAKRVKRRNACGCKRTDGLSVCRELVSEAVKRLLH